MNLFKKYETDRTKESAGVEITIEDCVFVCRRAGGGNRKYRFAIAESAMQLKHKLDSADENMVIEAEDEVTMRAFADAVVVDWRNVDDRNGQPWPFTRENFIELMEACPDVWNQLRIAARDADNFRATEAIAMGETLGNS